MATKISAPKSIESFEKWQSRMLETIKAAWPTFSEASIGLYSVFIRERAAAHGRDAVEKMIKNAMDQQVSLPTIAELKRYLPADTLRVKTTTDENCPCCEGTGWAWADQEQKRVRRCHCWRKESA